MKRATIVLSSELEDFVEEWLWIQEALSVGSQPPHEQERKLEAIFDELDEAAFQTQLNELVAPLPGEIQSLEVAEVQQQAWQEKWRENFEPLRIGSFDFVGEWETWEDTPKTIRIYPGQAFGTGQHETTQLIIERMEELDFNGQSVLDIGCGTGVLGIVAERLGADSVFGFDVDPDCKENMERHLQMNHCKKTRLEIGTMDQMQLDQYDLVLANITINVLSEVWPHLAKHVAPGGRVLNSGILADQEEIARTKLKEASFGIVDVRRKNDWIMIEAELTP